MPDWISHVLIGLAFAEIFHIRKKSLVVLGSLLPDFIVKINLLTKFFYINGDLLFVTRLYHSPLMGLLIPALIAPVFKYNFRKTWLYMMSGFMLHILADSFTKHFSDGILLYPLSNSYISFNIFWPEQYWIMLIGSASIYALALVIKHFKIFS